METISLKIESSLLKEIDSMLKTYRYSTRTEFIREAIRNRIEEMEKQKAIRELEKYFGSAKTHVSDERHEQIREEVAKEYAKKMGIKL